MQKSQTAKMVARSVIRVRQWDRFTGVTALLAAQDAGLSCDLGRVMVISLHNQDLQSYVSPAARILCRVLMQSIPFPDVSAVDWLSVERAAGISIT